MTVLTPLEEELRCSLYQHMDDNSWDVATLAGYLGMSPERAHALIAGQKSFSPRDIMRVAEAGLFPTPGVVTARRGFSHVRPMVFTREPRGIRYEPTVIRRSANGYSAGLDVEAQDLAGEDITLKISYELAREIARWWRDHEGFDDE